MTVVLVTKRHYKPQQTPLDKKKQRDTKPQSQTHFYSASIKKEHI